MDPHREMPSHLKEAGGLQPTLDLIGESEELEEGERGQGEPWGLEKRGPWSRRE